MPEIGSGVLYRRYIRAVLPLFAPASSAFGAAGRVFLAPLEICWPILIDQLIYQVAAVSAGNVRIGLYEEGSTSDSPEGGSLAVESASVAQPAANSLHSVTVSETFLVPGTYYLALQGDDTAGTMVRGYDAATLVYYLYDRAGGYGAFTDPCPSLTATTLAAIVAARVKTSFSVGQKL